MKILKQGVMYPQIVFNCPRCECIFLADEDDKILDSRDGDYVICPTCNRTIDWRFGESQKKQQEKQEKHGRHEKDKEESRRAAGHSDHAPAVKDAE